jgi:hypothetical protein
LYLAAVREALGQVPEGGEVGRWLAWADGVAGRLDPVGAVVVEAGRRAETQPTER